MKFRILILFALLSTTTFAQKARVTSAYNYERNNELDKAMEAINEATLDPTTSGFWKTWLFRGNIYRSIALSQDEQFANLSPNPVKEAYESYKKVYTLEMDKRMDMDDLNRKYKSVIPMAFNNGIAAYNNKEYEKAGEFFEICASVNNHFGVVDTLSLYNIALTADLAGNNEKAANYYEQCIKYGYRGAGSYTDLANLYLRSKNDEKAKDVLKRGRKAYPKDQGLLTAELNIYLRNNQFDEALENLNLAIENEPTNAIFYYARGTIYNTRIENYTDQKKESLAAEAGKKAEADYKKAIEFDADYFDAYYNLGALIYNRGADKINACNEIMDNKKYEACKKEADVIFADAIPYLEKALELNPEDQNTIVSLKQLYVRTNQTDKYNQLNSK